MLQVRSICRETSFENVGNRCDNVRLSTKSDANVEISSNHLILEVSVGGSNKFADEPAHLPIVRFTP